MKLNQQQKSFYLIILTVLSATAFILSTIFIPNLKPTIFSGKYGHLLNGQVIMLISALFVFLVTSVLFGKETWKYLSLKRKDGPITAVPFAGIKPKDHETWKNLGMQMAVTITLITSVVIYFQLASGYKFTFKADIVIVLLLALTNALSEEIIFRFSIVSSGQALGIKAKHTEYISGAIFGLAHYYGNPGGIIGVLMAGFIGWFLAKSMNETKGFFWAFLIHFLQDVVIFYALIITLS